MSHATATDVKNRLGAYLDAAQHEPVTIEKSGRKIAVLMSVTEYARLQALEDSWWGARAVVAEASGKAAPEQLQALIDRLG
jgi:antitoxin Phd